MDFRVTLDREAFKVLASDTRLDILKALDERGMTVSELGRRLDLNKATVFEHLEKLVAAGLVKKLDDEERKWVYYQLSWKARRILHPERVTIALLFSTALGALLSGLAVAAEYMRQAGQAAAPGGGQATPGPSPASPTVAGAAASADKAALPAAPAPPAADPALLAVAIALFVLVAVLAGIALHYRRQARRREAAERAPPA